MRLGLVDALDVFRLVVWEDVVDGDHADELTARVLKLGFDAGLDRGGLLLGDGEGDRNGPGVVLALALDDAVIEASVPLFAVHRAGKRREAAVTEAVQTGQIGVVDANDRHGRGGLREGLDSIGRDGAIDWCGKTTMNRNQISHESKLLKDACTG